MTILKSIAYSFSYLLALFLISSWILLVPNTNDSMWIANSSFINSIAQFLAVLLFLYISKNGELLKIKSTKGRFYFYAILLAMFFTYIQVYLNMLYYIRLPSGPLHLEFNIAKLFSSNVIASILIVPISEELFFRNFIQRGLHSKYSASLAIILASSLFAIIHLPFHALLLDHVDFDLHRAYIALFCGLISGVIYFRSESIGPSIVFHIIWNMLANISN